MELVVPRTIQLCSCVFVAVVMFAVYVSCGKLYGIHVTAWDENLEVAQMADEPK